MQDEKSKRDRNRESAKQSRKRKALYVDLLEAKVARLSSELMEIGRQHVPKPSFSQTVSVHEAVSGCLGCLFPQELALEISNRLAANGNCRDAAFDLTDYGVIEDDVIALVSVVQRLHGSLHGNYIQ